MRPHFSITSESDPADQDDIEVEEDHNEHATQEPRQVPSAVNEDNVHTSGVSTLSSTMSHDSQNAQRSLNMQLGRLKIESNRLLEELLQKERDFQALLRQAIEEKDQEIKRLQHRSQPINIPGISVSHTRPSNSNNEDLELIYWLRQHHVEEDTINKFLAEDYRLEDILWHVTRDDLKSMDLRGGALCAIWRAITDFREKQSS